MIRHRSTSMSRLRHSSACKMLSMQAIYDLPYTNNQVKQLGQNFELPGHLTWCGVATGLFQHTNWTGLQQDDPVTQRVHWSRASASRLPCMHQRNNKTVVRALWTFIRNNVFRNPFCKLQFSCLVQFTSCAVKKLLASFCHKQTSM